MIELNADGSLPGDETHIRFWLGAQEGEFFLNFLTTDNVAAHAKLVADIETGDAFVRWLTDWVHKDQINKIRSAGPGKGKLGVRVFQADYGRFPGLLLGGHLDTHPHHESYIEQRPYFRGWIGERVYFQPNKKDSPIKRHIDKLPNAELDSATIRDWYEKCQPVGSGSTGISRMLCIALEALAEQKGISLPKAQGL